MASSKLEHTAPGVFTPIQFPCGLTATNRLVKAPMYEHLANFWGGPPNDYHLAIYSTWSRYEWGMVITGNVQVSKSHLSLGRDLVIPGRLSEEALKPYKALAHAIKGSSGRTLAVMQLSHAGRQSSNFIGGRHPFKRPLAPSAIAVGMTTPLDDPVAAMVHNILFQTPKEMSSEDIEEVVAGFVRGARLAHESGFDGVELHVAHGYLLAQFLSPKSNLRQDSYSVHSNNGLRLLRQIVDGIRASVPPCFVVGIKLNASDYIGVSSNNCNPTSHPEETRALQHVLDIAGWGTVDFIDISGGDYENPEFMTTVTSKPGRRQAFFARFSQQALRALNAIGFQSPSRPVIMLTGGLRTPNLLRSALQSGQTDMVGIGRASVVCPRIPQIMVEFEQGRGQHNGDTAFGIEPEHLVPTYLKKWPLAPIWTSLSKVRLVGASFNMAWYTITMRRSAIAELHGRTGDACTVAPALNNHDHVVDGLWALIQMYLWIANPKKGPKSTIIRLQFTLGILIPMMAISSYHFLLQKSY